MEMDTGLGQTSGAIPFRPVTGQPGLEPPPSTTQVVYASISRWKDPLVALFKTDVSAPREEFDRSVPERYKSIAMDLYMTPRQQDFEYKKTLFDKDQLDRATFKNATFGQTVIGAVADPLSAIPIVRFYKGASLLGSAANVALTAGSVTAGEEVLRSSVMPGYDPMEGAFNVAASVAVGGLLGGGIYTGKKAYGNYVDNAHYRLGQHAQTIREMEDFVDRQEILKAMVKGQRPLGITDADTLRADSMFLSQQMTGKQQVIDRINNGQLNLPPSAIQTIEADILNMSSQRQAIIDELNIRRLDEGLVDGIEDPYAIASSFFDYVDIMPTPTKSIAKFKLDAGATPAAREALNVFKKTSLLLAGDSSVLYAGQKLGLTVAPSVDINVKLRRGVLYEFENKLGSIWRDATSAPKIAPNLVRRVTKSGPTLDEWLNSVNKKRIKGEPLLPKEMQAAQLMDDYLAKIGDEARQYGVIGSDDFINQRILVAQNRVDNANMKLRKEVDRLLAARQNDSDAAKYWRGQLTKFNDELTELNNSLAYIQSGPVRPMGKKEPFFMRQWDKDRIAIDEAGSKELRRKLTDFIRLNPYGVEYDNASGLYKPRDLTGDIPAQDRYVDTVIKSILTDNEPMTSATSRSNRYPSRAINVPNADVIDFINTDFRDVLRTYSHRTGSKIEFAKQFGGQTYDDIADDLVGDLVTNGVAVEKANMLRKDLTILYQRVTATTLSDPTSLTNRTVQFIKEFTSLNYLGGAGVTAIGDVSKIIFEHGPKNLFKGIVATAESQAWQRQLGSVKSEFGEALELALGVTQQMSLEDTGARVASNAWTTIKNAGFILNGLGPMTVALKSLSGSLAAHNFVDISRRVLDGSASKFDLEYLMRYGISTKTAKEIAKSAPVEKTANGLFVANIQDWGTFNVSTETIAAFRAAVAKSVGNTVLSSSPATRFTYADGSIFLPIKQARKIYAGAKEAEDFPGYVRMESGIMTMPFMFYNWSMSAVTNILQTAAQGQSKHRMAGFAAMFGFGYMLAKLRTPDWAWEDMDTDERLSAAFERSGIGAIYSDIALNSLRFSVQAGLNNPENDILPLSFYGEDGFGSAATTILGAGTSTIKDGFDASAKLAGGDYAEALKEFYLMLPLTGLFWLKEDSNAFINNVTGIR